MPLPHNLFDYCSIRKSNFIEKYLVVKRKISFAYKADILLTKLIIRGVMQMEWRKSENADKAKPEAVQFDYNCETVYVRKDFENHKEEVGENPLPEHWSYRELKITLRD